MKNGSVIRRGPVTPVVRMNKTNGENEMSTFTFNCQHCGEWLEAPEDMRGETIDCPSCNAKIELTKREPEPPPNPRPQRSVPHFFINTERRTPPKRAVRTNVKQGALIGGVVCFALGVLMMNISLWTFNLYAPLFFAAFVLSIVAMAQKRIAGGVILLLLTITVPPVLLIAVPSFKFARSTAQENAQVPKNPELDERMGFRNFRLGRPISDFNSEDLQAAEARVKTDMRSYRVLNFDSKLGAAEINSIELNFDEDLLQSVVVRVSGEQNEVALREVFIAGYGEPDRSFSFMGDSILWEGDDCILTLTSFRTGGASARFSSKSVDKKIEEIKLQKAKEGAAAGVEGL